jgi:hypothetical protein
MIRYEAILKFGSMIVEKLVGYKHPVLVYVPPGITPSFTCFTTT